MLTAPAHHPAIAAVLAAAPWAALCLSPADRILAANARAEALFMTELAGRVASDVVRHPDFHRALAEARAGLGAGLADDGADAPLRTGPRAELMLATPGGWGAFVAHFGMYGDLCLVFLEDRTEFDQAAEIRRDFVANVSHELRTPLTALVGFIETLKGAAQNDPAARERFLAIMEREAQRMIRLVNDLLSLSRVEAVEFRRPSGQVDLRAILALAQATVRDQAAAAGVTIRVLGDPAPIQLPGDGDQLQQVVMNLLENAIKYGAPKGEVRLILTRIEREPKLRRPAIAIAVEDDGEGIDALHLPRLTERFYRIDTHRSREKGGTGLGLAIVKHIVNRHRGRLKIESTLGKGSRFSVILPLQ